jgi:hypothetical protein
MRCTRQRRHIFASCLTLLCDYCIVHLVMLLCMSDENYAVLFQVQAVELLLLLGQIHEAAGAPLTALPYVLSCLLHSTVLHMDLLVCLSPLFAVFTMFQYHAICDRHASNLMTDILLLVNAAHPKHTA